MKFNGQEFKPLMHKLRHVPDYYISEDAKILSTKRIKGKGVPKLMDYKRKQKLDHPDRGAGKQTYKRPMAVNLSVDVSQGLFPEYDYVMSTNGQGQVSTKHAKINVRYHRAVLESWKPIDDCHRRGVRRPIFPSPRVLPPVPAGNLATEQLERGGEPGSKGK